MLCVLSILLLNYFLLKVRHSQRMKETPLSCWVVVEENGYVCCSCMAGGAPQCKTIHAIEMHSLIFNTECSNV